METLATRLESMLDGLSRLDAAGGQPEAEMGRRALALAKRVSFEILHGLVSVAELDASSRDVVARVLGRASLYERLPHPRFRLTQDWFSANIPVWSEVLRELAGRPNVRALEIGSFEGLSACFLLESVLTHPTSRIVCIDPFDSPGQMQAERYFDHNIEATQCAYKVTKLKGRSGEVLPVLSGMRFDLVYVDGSHAPADALSDALAIWPLLERGGTVIFDDYEIGASYPAEIGADVDPKPGIDAFLSLVRGQYEEVHRGYQIIIRRS